MKFKLDENLPSELVGAKDPELMAVAAAEGRILLTMDKGIADVQEYPPAEHAGVVLFHPSRSGHRTVFAFIRDRLTELLELELEGRLTVVGPTRIRVS